MLYKELLKILVGVIDAKLTAVMVWIEYVGKMENVNLISHNDMNKDLVVLKIFEKDNGHKQKNFFSVSFRFPLVCRSLPFNKYITLWLVNE